MTKRTSKKTKVIGTETYINQQTGEIQEMEVIDIQESTDANFHKIWIAHIINALDLIGGKKVKVLNYLLDSMNKENLIVGTQRAIAEKSDTSTFTVSQTMRALQDADIIAQVQAGVYRLNPNVIFKGYRSSRMNVLYKYSSERNNYTKTESDKHKKHRTEKEAKQKRKTELKSLKRKELLKILKQKEENNITSMLNNNELINLIIKQEQQKQGDNNDK